jgi:hypothetical protein
MMTAVNIDKGFPKRNGKTIDWADGLPSKFKGRESRPGVRSGSCNLGVWRRIRRRKMAEARRETGHQGLKLVTKDLMRKWFGAPPGAKWGLEALQKHLRASAAVGTFFFLAGCKRYASCARFVLVAIDSIAAVSDAEEY